MRRVVNQGVNSFNNVKLYKWGEVCEVMDTPRLPISNLGTKALQVVDNLKKFASMNGFCSLSANQIYQKPRIFVCLKKPLLVPQQWTDYDKVKPDDYEAIINPQLKEESVYKEYGYEECSSLPLFKFKVLRSVQSWFEWKDELMVLQRKPIEGFQLRVWQHEYTHMEGAMIADSQYCNGEIELKDEVKDLETEAQLESFKNYYKFIDDPKGYADSLAKEQSNGNTKLDIFPEQTKQSIKQLQNALTRELSGNSRAQKSKKGRKSHQ